ncbi:substrate-binding domain-containing protein [bacterium]|nr:substrate-binding domain-containing protein [bacterium]
MRRGSLLLALAGVVIVAMSGCTKTGPQEAGPPAPAVAPAAPGPGAATPGKITVLMVPKLKGIDYFNACEKGAREAAQALGNVELIFDGPTEDKADAQNQLIDGYIAQNVNVIAISPNDPDSIAGVLKKARAKGIHVLTWDADANPEKSGREFFVNQASSEAVGAALVDEMAAQKGKTAKVAIVTSSLTAANQNAWIKAMKARMASQYPQMKLVCDPKPSEENQQLAFQVTQDLLKTYRDLDGVFAISSVAFPGAADAVQQAKQGGKVAVVGLATPKPMRQWVEAGTVKTVILWNPVDLGYATIQAAQALAEGKLAAGAKALESGRLGSLTVSGDQVLLGPPMEFTKDNIAQFDF